MENDVVDDSKTRVSARMGLEVDVSESNLSHGQNCLVQWAVNGVSFSVVDDVGDDGVSGPVVSSVFEFVDDYRIWVLAYSSLDGFQYRAIAGFRNVVFATQKFLLLQAYSLVLSIIASCEWLVK